MLQKFPVFVTKVPVLRYKSAHSFGLIFVSPQWFFLSSLSCSLAPFLRLNICLAPVFFSLLLSLVVLPHSFGLIFVSPLCFFLSSLSYCFSPFLWRNICIAFSSLAHYSSYKFKYFLWPFFLCPSHAPRLLVSPPSDNLVHSVGFFASPQFLSPSPPSHSLAPFSKCPFPLSYSSLSGLVLVSPERTLAYSIVSLQATALFPPSF